MVDLQDDPDTFEHEGNWGIIGVNDSFLVTMQPGSSTVSGPPTHRIVVQCFDESLHCADFSSTGIWDDRDTGLLRTLEPDGPDKHPVPYPEI